MTSSLLIKDEAARVVGYALLQDGQLCIRMNCEGETARVCVSAEGEETVLDVPCDLREHAFAWRKKSIERVRIGSAHPSACADDLQEQENSSKKQAQGCKTGGDCGVYIRKEHAACAPLSLPSTRWPPPPCWPSARYVDGIWEEGGD